MKNEILNLLKERSKYWWTSLVSGTLAIILAIWCIATPETALIAITYVFIVAFFISGISDIIFAISNRNIYYGWGWTLTAGIIDLLFGLLLILLPQPLVTTMLVYFVGFWILFRSIWTIGIAAELNGFMNSGGLLILSILSLIFAIFYLLSPVFFGGAMIVVLVSIAFLFYGIFRIFYAFQLKTINKKIEELKNE